MYIADLHIHSRYSRATSRDLTPEQLDFQARQKGIRLLGTGDFTHPAWRSELQEKLEPAEDGLYRLKKENVLNPQQGSEEDQTRFVISGEISSIYKQDGKVRKVHSLILLPGLEAAEKLSAKLETLGNIHSDGRPILGLSCHDLLEIMLEICPEGMFIPAHIWTPHFSMFGAFSGFDRVEECFGELTPYIHAVETGLSSDPPMNWRLSALDRFQLISNSDAHSPAKLGREANLLGGDLSYEGLKKAVETGEGLEGTIEFFPEEGKYHYDGHRKCHVCLSPSEAEDCKGICPVCQKKLTIGVSHRAEQLADRPENFVPKGAKPFESLVPLPEVIAASTGRSAAGKRVQEEYRSMIRELGTEFAVLREVPVEDIRHRYGHLISEGIRRLREGLVTRLPGFDGEYGTIKLFEPDEIANPDGQMSMSGLLDTMGAVREMPLETKNEKSESGKTDILKKTEESRRKERVSEREQPSELLVHLNQEQRKAAELPARSLAVVAGPGTGKTGTLAARIRCLIEKRRVKASEITAVTFTNRAALELRERLHREMPHRRASQLIQTGTFHSICSTMLRQAGEVFDLANQAELMDLADEILEERKLKLRPSELLKRVSEEKISQALREREGKEDAQSEDREKERYPEILSQCEEKEKKREDAIKAAVSLYRERLKSLGLFDFDDLLIETLHLLIENNEKVRESCHHFRYLLVDEFQDINFLQYRLIQEWNRDGRELFVIGDPDQSIYGFRGSDPECFQRLSRDYPETEVIRLQENYRSTAQVTEAACSLISHNSGEERKLLAVSGSGLPVRIVKAEGKRAEGIFAAREVNRMIGGIDMLDAQGREYGGEKEVRSFSDIAILCRTNRQTEEMEEYLRTEGIPYIITGRGEFLEEETVREAVGFFGSLVREEYGHDRGEKRERRQDIFLKKRMGEEALSRFQEKYRPLLKKKPSDLIKSWMEDRELSEDKPLSKLMSMALFHKTMDEFLTNLAFGRESDLRRCGAKKYTSDAVSLMTLHASKGLEFPAVVIPGVEKYSIPLEWSEKKDGLHGIDREEERRLFYVGMTRAREELILVTSGEPSLFLSELPDSVSVKEEAFGQSRPQIKQLSLFDFM